MKFKKGGTYYVIIFRKIGAHLSVLWPGFYGSYWCVFANRGHTQVERSTVIGVSGGDQKRSLKDTQD